MAGLSIRNCWSSGIFTCKPHLGFTEDSPKQRNYPVKGSSMGGNAYWCQRPVDGQTFLSWQKATLTQISTCSGYLWSAEEHIWTQNMRRTNWYMFSWHKQYENIYLFCILLRFYLLLVVYCSELDCLGTLWAPSIEHLPLPTCLFFTGRRHDHDSQFCNVQNQFCIQIRSWRCVPAWAWALNRKLLGVDCNTYVCFRIHFIWTTGWTQ